MRQGEEATTDGRANEERRSAEILDLVGVGESRSPVLSPATSTCETQEVRTVVPPWKGLAFTRSLYLCHSTPAMRSSFVNCIDETTHKLTKHKFPVGRGVS